MKILKKIDLTSFGTLCASTLFLWLLIVASADYLHTMLTARNLPDVYANHMQTVRLHTWFIASVLSFPVVGGLFYLINRIERLRLKLQDVVRHDDLTGLKSREAFLEDFREEVQNSDQPVSDAFLIVDADFFKKINDTHGHIAGDRALVAITDALQKGIRGTDSLGRLGGEEFAVHLRGVNKERAMEIAERLRKNVMAASGNAQIPNLNLTVSIGAVYYDSQQDVVSLLTAADRLLYKAKDNGRNRVEFEHSGKQLEAA